MAAVLALALNAGGGFVRAATSGDPAASAWCGAPLSAEARADLDAVFAAAKGGARRVPIDDHGGGPCHACPMGCAALAAPAALSAPIAYASAARAAIDDEAPLRDETARGPPVGGRAPPARM